MLIACENRFHYSVGQKPVRRSATALALTDGRTAGIGRGLNMKVLFAALALLQIVWAGVASACSLPQPAGEVVLTIEGQIQECNAGLEAHLDMAMIEALPKFEVKTKNPWEETEVTYEGVLLRDILAYVKANGSVLSVTALNDYRADISVAETRDINVILAYKRNGDYMPVREKGPLFVVFPFTDDPALAIEAHFAQSVWQVARIAVK